MRPRWLTRRLASLPIRWRLALVSAGLTFVILLAFAMVIGAFTTDRLRSDFDNEVRATAAELETRVEEDIQTNPLTGQPQLNSEALLAMSVAGSGDGAVRIVDSQGRVIVPPGAPELGPISSRVRQFGGYRAVSTPLATPGSAAAAGYLQYGREVSSLEATIARVKFFLGLGVAGGTLLALLAGLAVARRAMGPIADLTRGAREIARTGDPAGRMPQPRADDEVADLARTLEEMLKALDASRRETEVTLEREREFVADASHELRTPLTSVLANLELLEETLEGEDREIAGSALRSTQRMRRLVGDLLFLARADAGRPAPSTLASTDLSAVVREVVAETAPLATSHEVSLDAGSSGAVVEGSPDDLHRLALNLVQNAVAHTPPGTRVAASVRTEGDEAVLEVTDDGPGVPEDVRRRAFDRFVRGGGDGRGAIGLGGRGSGLGLAIVAAVADAHGGGVRLDDVAGGGASFEVRLPLAGVAEGTGGEGEGASEAARASEGDQVDS